MMSTAATRTAASRTTAVGAAPAFLTGAAGALPSRTVAVLEAIKHAILTGELRPGQALVETDLAEVLGVSKTPVREALKTLAGAGLVTMNPYKGAAVRVVDDEQARHVYDARLLLEPEALARAVRLRGQASVGTGSTHTRPSTGPTTPRIRPNAAWPTATSTASSTPAAATRSWSRCSTTCATRPPWSARPPGATSPITRRPRAGSTRRPSTGACSGPRKTVTPSARPPSSAITSPRSSPATFVKPQENQNSMSLTPAAAETLRQALATVVVVPVTPLHADGNPDWAAYAALTRRLIDGGITVITPNGNTGEFYALSQAEARQVVETAAAASNGQAELLAGVGHDIATAVEAAGHARDHGARMIMIHQPVHPYVSREGWIDYHAAIASNVPDLGIVLYLRNERITGADIAALADRAPNVIGVKYGVRDASTFAAVARDAGIDRFTWLAGAAELTAPAYWACGAHGFTSGLANVTPELPLAMLDALRGQRLRPRR